MKTLQRPMGTSTTPATTRRRRVRTGGASGSGGGLGLGDAPASPFAATLVPPDPIADIVEAVEGPIAMSQCCGGEDASDCALDAHCRVKPHMNIVSNAVRGALGAVSLASLADKTPAHPEEPLSEVEAASRRTSPAE